jgi:hypothetical protein
METPHFIFLPVRCHFHTVNIYGQFFFLFSFRASLTVDPSSMATQALPTPLFQRQVLEDGRHRDATDTKYNLSAHELRVVLYFVHNGISAAGIPTLIPQDIKYSVIKKRRGQWQMMAVCHSCAQRTVAIAFWTLRMPTDLTHMDLPTSGIALVTYLLSWSLLNDAFSGLGNTESKFSTINDLERVKGNLTL